MIWEWRGEYFPLNRSEFEFVKHNLEFEKFQINAKQIPYTQLQKDKQLELLKQRVKKYCTTVYKKMHITEVNIRLSYLTLSSL
jgi:hypothetical protein